MVQASRVGGSVPSYKHCLFVLGQYLNQQRARLATVAEVDTGYMVFLYPEGNYQKQRTLIVSFADLLDLAGDFAPAARGRKGGILRGGTARDKRHPLLPQGYGTVFHALGSKLDQRQASCITVCETTTALYLDYWVDNATFVVRDQRRQAVSHHQQETYDAAGVRRMQDTVRLHVEQESGRHTSALRINPHDYLSGMQMALLLEDDGNYAAAEDIFQRVAAQVPDHADAHYHHARLASIRGDRRAALQAVRKAVTLRPDLAAVQDLYGRILQQHGKLAEATEALQEAVALDPGTALHYVHLAAVYEALGQKDAAAAEMARITFPHAAPAWDDLDTLLFDESPALAHPAVAEQAAPESAPPEAVPAAEAAAAAEEEFAAHQPFDASWGAPALMDGRQFAEGMRSTVSPAPLETPPLTTVFSTIESLPWAQPESQLPTLAASAQLPSLPAEPETAWLHATLPAAVEGSSVIPTLSQRLRAAGSPGTGSLAARVPVEPLPGDLPAYSADTASFFLEAQPSPAFTVVPAGASPGGLPETAPIEQAALSLPSTSFARMDTGVADSTADTAGAVEIAAEIMTIQRALEAEPNRADLHRKLGFLLARQGRAADAAAEFRKALQYSRMSL